MNGGNNTFQYRSIHNYKRQMRDILTLKSRLHGYSLGREEGAEFVASCPVNTMKINGVPVL